MKRVQYGGVRWFPLNIIPDDEKPTSGRSIPSPYKYLTTLKKTGKMQAKAWMGGSNVKLFVISGIIICLIHSYKSAT